MPQGLAAGGRWRTFPGKLAVVGLLFSLCYGIPYVSGQAPETLTGPGSFQRGIATIILDPEDSVAVVVDPATGRVTIEVLTGTATVLIEEISLELRTGAVVQIELLPETGAIRITAVSGPDVTVTAGGVSIAVPAGAVVQIELLPETGAIRITAVSGPDVTVTAGGVSIAVPAGTSTTILPGEIPPPPALSLETLPSVETAAPPPPSVQTPVIGREVPLSPTR